MREYWQGLFMGALVGVAATVFYKNNKSEINRTTRQVKAKYKNMVNDLEDRINDFSDEKQES